MRQGCPILSVKKLYIAMRAIDCGCPGSQAREWLPLACAPGLGLQLAGFRTNGPGEPINGGPVRREHP